MSTAVLEYVIRTAAESIQRNQPTMELAISLAIAGFKDHMIPLPKSCKVPLFTLRYLHASTFAIPEGCVFIDGPEEAFMSFWMYMLSTKVASAKALLGIDLRRGNDTTRHIAHVFIG